MKGGTILIGLFLVFCLFFGYQYNSVKSARLNVDAAYGQVENQMQRQADLIPNLVRKSSAQPMRSLQVRSASS